MNKLNELKIKRILSEYKFLLDDSEYKTEIIDSGKSEFLNQVSEVVKKSGLKSKEDSDRNTSKSLNKKIEDSDMSKSSKNSFKKMFRNIVKVTHPDRTGSDRLLDTYTQAKEAYDTNDYLKICAISNNLNLEVIIEDEDLDLILKLMDIKRKEIESLEKSWMWVWLNSASQAEKDLLVNSYCKANFSNKSDLKVENLDLVLDKIYSISPYQKKYTNRTHFNTESDSVYGESTKIAVDSIVECFKDYFNESTVFYDLGCGLGKIVAHIGLKYLPKKSIGVELSKERLLAANFMMSEYNLPDSISYVNESFLNVDLSDATVVYCDNTMYDDSITLKLYDNLPIGCLFICRRNPLELKDLNTKSDPSFKTTYNKNTIYYIIKK